MESVLYLYTDFQLCGGICDLNTYVVQGLTVLFFLPHFDFPPNPAFFDSLPKPSGGCYYYFFNLILLRLYRYYLQEGSVCWYFTLLGFSFNGFTLPQGPAPDMVYVDVKKICGLNE